MAAFDYKSITSVKEVVLFWYLLLFLLSANLKKLRVGTFMYIIIIAVHFAETIIQRCFVKKVFLKIWQYSSILRSLFNNISQVFSRKHCETFQNTCFEEYLRTGGSDFKNYCNAFFLCLNNRFHEL